MRATLLALAAIAAVAAGCGSSSRPGQGGIPAGTLEALWRQPGEDVTAVPGTSDHAPGVVRLSFLVVRRDGRTVDRPRARVWLANELRAKPFEEVTADLQPIGVPGVAEGDAGDVSHLYVAHLRVPRPGKYWYLAEPVGAANPIQAIGNLVVKDAPSSPAVGAKAYPSRTPTLADVDGDASELSTGRPPNRALLRFSVSGSLAQGAPFVLVFATPRWCMSRTCGPVVDVVEAVRRRHEGSHIRFVHVEIYKENNPRKGFNRWVKEWRLPTEPWTFVVGSDGRIKAKFEGSLSVGELDAAVRSSFRR